MESMRGQVIGKTVAKYRLDCFTLTCKIADGKYFVTFHNGRQSAMTHYSTDKNEMNDYIRKALRDGYKRVF